MIRWRLLPCSTTCACVTSSSGTYVAGTTDLLPITIRLEEPGLYPPVDIRAVRFTFDDAVAPLVELPAPAACELELRHIFIRLSLIFIIQ